MHDSFYFLGGSAAAGILEKTYGPKTGPIIMPAEGQSIYTDGELSLVFKGCIYAYADPFLPCDSEEEYIIAAPTLSSSAIAAVRIVHSAVVSGFLVNRIFVSIVLPPISSIASYGIFIP